MRKSHGRVSPVIEGPSLTQQQYKDETDINTITKRYLRTGNMPQSNKQGVFGDFTSLEYLEMQNAIVDANNAFAKLPARTRRRFDNDPYQLLRFVENEENRKEAEFLGLLEPKPEKPPEAVQTDLEEAAKAATGPAAQPPTP